MRVYGEAYLFINFWMDYLSLLLAACLRRRRFHGARTAAGAAVGAVYALLARSGKAFLQGFPGLLVMLPLIAFISFGRTGISLFPWIAASALLLCGLADVLMNWGASAAAVVLVCGLAALLCCVCRRREPSEDGACALQVVYRGQRLALPAIRDSGNLLRDGVTGQPVIVAPESALVRLIPRGVQPANLATLPPGWRLLPIRTALGNGLIMCFRPDAVKLVRDGKAKRLDVTIAVSGGGVKTALVPDELFFR